MIQQNRFYLFLSSSRLALVLMTILIVSEFVSSTNWLSQENDDKNKSNHKFHLHQYQLTNYESEIKDTIHNILCVFDEGDELETIQVKCQGSKQKKGFFYNAIRNRNKRGVHKQIKGQRLLQKDRDKQNDREKEKQEKTKQVHSEYLETAYVEENLETPIEDNDFQGNNFGQDHQDKKNKNENDKGDKVEQLQPGNLKKINEKKTENPIKPNNPGKGVDQNNHEDISTNKIKTGIPKNKDTVKDVKEKDENDDLNIVSSWITWQPLLTITDAPSTEVYYTPTASPIQSDPVVVPIISNSLSANPTVQIIPTFFPSSSPEVSVIPTTSHFIPAQFPTPNSNHPISNIDHFPTKLTDLPSVRTVTPSLPKSLRPTSYSDYTSTQTTYSPSINTYPPSSSTNSQSESSPDSKYSIPTQTSSEIKIGLGVLLEYIPNNSTQSDTVHQDYVAVDAVLSTLGLIIDNEDSFHVISLNHRRYGKTVNQPSNHQNTRNLVELGHNVDLSTFQLHEKFDTIEDKHYHVIEVYTVFRILNFEIGYSNEPHNTGNELLYQEETDDDLTTANVKKLVNKIVIRTLDDGSFLNLARERDQHIVSISEIHKIPTLKSIISYEVQSRYVLESFSAIRLSGVLMLLCLTMCTGVLFVKAKRRYELIGYLDDLESQNDCRRKVPKSKRNLDGVLNPEGMILKLKIKPDPCFELSSMLEWQNPDKTID